MMNNGGVKFLESVGEKWPRSGRISSYLIGPKIEAFTGRALYKNG
jgi:hypothetical protein